jgi:hypothetical protein
LLWIWWISPSVYSLDLEWMKVCVRERVRTRSGLQKKTQPGSTWVNLLTHITLIFKFLQRPNLMYSTDIVLIMMHCMDSECLSGLVKGLTGKVHCI